MTAYRTEIHRLFNAVEAIWTKTDDMPIQQMLCLLAIARHPGITAEQLGKEVGINQSSVSRNTTALAKWHRLGKPGADYIEKVQDPVETRRFIYFPTPGGWKVVKKAIEAIAGHPLPDFEGQLAEDAWDAAARARRGT